MASIECFDAWRLYSQPFLGHIVHSADAAESSAW
jgi:hypothetical protein